MKGLFLLLVLGSAVTPIQKVVQLLNGMVQKGKKEKQDEQTQFAAFQQWCHDTEADKTQAIAEADEQIDRLTASMEKAEVTAEKLSREIAKNDEDINVYEGDQKAASTVRKMERDDFVALNRDYSESIDALRRAINVLKSQSHDRKQAQEALLQISNLIPEKSKKAVSSFIALAGEDDADHLSVEAPEAHGYEFQSQSIVDMLQGLHGKFDDERRALQKKEMEDKHAFESLMQDLKHQVKDTTRQRTENSAARADQLRRKAEAKSSLADTTATRDDDAVYLKETQATCTQKASDFEQRQELRADELNAIAQAIEILSSGAVSGAAEKHLPSFTATSFTQLRSTRSKNDDDQYRVARYLQDQAQKLHSHLLSALAVKVEEDPFKKVRQMIQNLIHNLLEEANQEAEQKGWCDKELADNKNTRDQKSEAVDQLTARRNELEASIQQLKEQLVEHRQQKQTIIEERAAAEKNRMRESENNADTIKDAKEAQTAVARAVGVLQQFYERAGKATALVQQPAIFDSPYQGMGGENNGVLGMLEVIQSDFARLETETETAEQQAMKEHENYLHTAEVSLTQLTSDIDHKDNKVSNEKRALEDAKGDLDDNQKALDEALNTYDKLKHQCIDAGVSYEDRVARRKAEIESLKEALKILSGEV